MSDNELSYCELRAKEVVNAADGKRMGRIVDILFARDTGAVSGIVVPFSRRSVFGKSQDIFIPWRCVQKIGEDVILVTLTVEPDGRVTCKSPPLPPPKECRDKVPSRAGEKPDHDCDGRCEKCMLFDCAYRWSQLS